MLDSKKHIAELHKKYPSARIVAASFDDVALAFEKCSDNLPVITSEIADTWIYGYASSPMKIARYRELLRLYSLWTKKGVLISEGIHFCLYNNLWSTNYNLWWEGSEAGEEVKSNIMA